MTDPSVLAPDLVAAGWRALGHVSVFTCPRGCLPITTTRAEDEGRRNTLSPRLTLNAERESQFAFHGCADGAPSR